MPKVILICGKICSGKSHYIKEIRRTSPAVVLSCDELMKALFAEDLEEKHDEVVCRVKDYLYNKSLEMISAGADVILDFGFWTKAEREAATLFYKQRCIETQWHYIAVTDEDWRRNIEKRNREVTEGISRDYYVDEGLLQKLNNIFEEPDREEIDIWYENHVIKRPGTLTAYCGQREGSYGNQKDYRE